MTMVIEAKLGDVVIGAERLSVRGMITSLALEEDTTVTVVLDHGKTEFCIPYDTELEIAND